MGFIASIKKKINGKTKRKTLEFTTSLQCGGCIKKVQPHLDTIEGLYTWKVNLNSAKKTLKADVDPEEVEKVKNDIIEALNKEQYTAEPMK